MSNYSYSEIQNMQKKALARVREMQRNSERFIEENEKNTTYIKPTNFFEDPQPTVKTKVTNMPPNFPQNTSYPNFKEFFKSEEQQEKMTKTKVNKVNTNILDEPDKAIILGLIMLLKSEGADELLIMALMYIIS